MSVLAREDEGQHRLPGRDRLLSRRSMGMPVAHVVFSVRRKSPTAAVAQDYSNHLGEESHVDNN